MIFIAPDSSDSREDSNVLYRIKLSYLIFLLLVTPLVLLPLEMLLNFSWLGFDPRNDMTGLLALNVSLCLSVLVVAMMVGVVVVLVVCVC